MVRDLFQEEDAKAILSISICEGMVDNFAWHFDQRGIFSVKSAYKIGVMLRDRRLGRDVATSKENSANNTVKFDWKHVWSLKATSKVKMFVWRLAHNSLANCMKIQKLGVGLDTGCPVCHRLNEDGGHTFLKCKKAKECRNILALGETREKPMLCNSAHSMLQELWRCDEDTQLKAVTFMWEWWNVRNKANAGEAAPKPQVVCHYVEKLLIESLGLRKLNKPPKPSDIHRWSKPPVHHVKVNFDGVDENTGVGGWGYVVRD
ncbi:uncharacterized protein [Aegilops tauschii subsp. strangulata]|uniref:uncharacterized protein n=1 Tax=Aegilops tauschii subsp. strangulata TaxID=200361 RepID=UPI00098BC59E|nr:uncharacterized protein LOC109753947 [Aegilops tauschii subsp. strangulata]